MSQPSSISHTPHIWIIENDQSILEDFTRAFARTNLRVQYFDSREAFLKAVRKDLPDILIAEVSIFCVDGRALLTQIKKKNPALPIVLLTELDDLEHTTSTYQKEIYGCLTKPLDVYKVKQVVQRALPKLDGGRQFKFPSYHKIIGDSPAIQEIFRTVERLSNSSFEVLLTGESGSGKELVAEAIHYSSFRAKGPFIAINTAAIPAELLESELFGHEKGAFTGAIARRVGFFERASGGTLFLDEIGDMPISLQSRLLRVLANKEFSRVGSNEILRSDVRIISATHQDLDRSITAGSFREDLLHRLNTINIYVPSLRERRSDIPLLLNYFLEQAARETQVICKKLLPETVALLTQLDWPGNVRELQNFCRWITVMASGRLIHPRDLSDKMQHAFSKASEQIYPQHGSSSETIDWEELLSQWAEQRFNSGATNLLDEALPKFERVITKVALRHTRGRRHEAAKLIGWGRNTITRKINELELD